MSSLHDGRFSPSFCPPTVTVSQSRIAVTSETTPRKPKTRSPSMVTVMTAKPPLPLACL